MDFQEGWWKKFLLGLGVCAGIMAGTAGCETVWDHEPYLSQPKIKAGPQEAFVRTEDTRMRRYRIAVLPFRVPAVVTDVSYPITEVFHRQLLEKRPFLGVVRVHKYYNSLAEAQELAKAQGADLFLMGEVPYFIDSGTTGRSGVQVDLRVVETKTGGTVWYLSDNIMAQPAPMIDLWVTESKPKPSPSIYFLVDTLAARMSLAMLRDLKPPDDSQATAKSSSSGSQKPTFHGICTPGEGELPEICNP
ncbi:MAG: hypothetical protein AB1424_11820 [Thermodesulfobacteriota bacterium]